MKGRGVRLQGFMGQGGWSFGVLRALSLQVYGFRVWDVRLHT